MASPGPVNPLPPDLWPHLRAALRILLDAWDNAAQFQRHVWEFAVDVNRLQALGVTPEEIRWLIENKYVHHALELTGSAPARQVVEPANPSVLADNSRFVLTAASIEALRKLESQTSVSPPRLPHYAVELRELRLERELVKRFRQPAPKQHGLLSAFEEQHWPPRIENPLDPHPADAAAKLSLNRAIQRLNRCQKTPLIRFRGDGTGMGVIWELRDPTSGRP